MYEIMRMISFIIKKSTDFLNQFCQDEDEVKLKRLTALTSPRTVRAFPNLSL